MIVYLDMDDVLCDYQAAHQKALLDNPSIAFPQSQYGFFANLDPLEGAIDATKALEASSQYQPYILIAPSVKNPLCYTEKRVWVEKWLGFSYVSRLIICSEKSLLKGEYLIDDNISGKGQEGFEGEIIHFGSKEYPNWTAIREYLSI